MKTSDSPPSGLDSTQMALDRIWLAHERTLMAWVRTAASMISFGFTIYKFSILEGAEDGRSWIFDATRFRHGDGWHWIDFTVACDCCS